MAILHLFNLKSPRCPKHSHCSIFSFHKQHFDLCYISIILLSFCHILSLAFCIYFWICNFAAKCMCVLFLHHSLLKYFGFNDIFCRVFFIPTGYFYSIELMKKKIITENKISQFKKMDSRKNVSLCVLYYLITGTWICSIKSVGTDVLTFFRQNLLFTLMQSAWFFSFDFIYFWLCVHFVVMFTTIQW